MRGRKSSQFPVLKCLLVLASISLLPSMALADCSTDNQPDCTHVPAGASVTLATAVVQPSNPGSLAVLGVGFTPSCQKIANNCGVDVMVPFGYQSEWGPGATPDQSFTTHPPSCVMLTACATSCTTVVTSNKIWTVPAGGLTNVTYTLVGGGGGGGGGGQTGLACVGAGTNSLGIPRSICGSESINFGGNGGTSAIVAGGSLLASAAGGPGNTGNPLGWGVPEPTPRAGYNGATVNGGPTSISAGSILQIYVGGGGGGGGGMSMDAAAGGGDGAGYNNNGVGAAGPAGYGGAGGGGGGGNNSSGGGGGGGAQYLAGFGGGGGGGGGYGSGGGAGGDSTFYPYAAYSGAVGGSGGGGGGASSAVTAMSSITADPLNCYMVPSGYSFSWSCDPQTYTNHYGAVSGGSGGAGSGNGAGGAGGATYDFLNYDGSRSFAGGQGGSGGNSGSVTLHYNAATCLP